MFIRQYFKNENSQRTAYWALVESYRAANGPRQRVVAWLGKLDEAGRLGVLRAAEEAKANPDKRRVFDLRGGSTSLIVYRSSRLLKH